MLVIYILRYNTLLRYQTNTIDNSWFIYIKYRISCNVAKEKPWLGAEETPFSLEDKRVESMEKKQAATNSQKIKKI